MRSFFLFILFSTLADVFCASKLQAHYLFGRRYYNLDHWADSESLAFNWHSKATVAHLTNRWSKLTFATDSQLASIDGINVWLSYPTVHRGANLYISEIDVEKTLTPILHPVKAKAGQRIQKIAISAGHGGRDPGYIDRYTSEKEQTLLLARELRTVLRNAGLDVYMVRDQDKYLTLEEKAAAANRSGADLFINLHFNRSVPTVRGLEVYCLPPARTPSTSGESSSGPLAGNTWDHRNVLLAYHIHKSIKNSIGFSDRGVRKARFVVLNEARIPAVLVEAGFLSNREDAKLITAPQARKALAQSIYDGIVTYKKMVERGAPAEVLPIPPSTKKSVKK